MVENKICPKCKRILELNLKNFYKDKNTKNGFNCYCKECSKLLRKECYNKNPLLVHDQNLKRLYGITYDDYLKLLEKQNHRCAICNLVLEETKSNNGRENKHFNIDHDHKTGKIRGLLCTNCNRGTGMFSHNPLILFNAIKYLKEY